MILVYERQFLTKPAVYSLFCEDCQSDLTREENAQVPLVCSPRTRR